MGQRAYGVYILASRLNGTLYCGVTSRLAERLWEHQNDLVEGFTKRYGVRPLVWYEGHETALGAIVREERIKQWNRAWKTRLIESSDPHWNDLSRELY